MNRASVRWLIAGFVVGCAAAAVVAARRLCGGAEELPAETSEKSAQAAVEEPVYVR
jgi:hypothetical protein